MQGLALVAAFAAIAAAFPPNLLDRRAATSTYNIGPRPTNNPNATNGYIAPGPGDVRSPCPALNTLANHGFLPRNGQNISRHQIQQAFVDGFNVGFSVTETPKENAFAVCQLVQKEYCYTLNLNVLNDPFTFEHQHSLSRQDFPLDNHDFNSSIFKTSLEVLKGSSHMTFQQANEVRLQRESLASIVDEPGYFVLAQATQETELGFIYAIMKDFTLPNYLTNPLVRVEWWDFWFSYESFPTPLGWMRPTIQIQNSFVTSVSSAIRTNQVITSTPTPFATSFLKRSGDKDAAATVMPISTQTVEPTLTVLNPYATSYNVNQWSTISTAMEAHVTAVGGNKPHCPACS